MPSIENKINQATARAGISQAELARQMNTTPSNLNQKIKRETLKQSELEQIAEICGGHWVAQFQFDDGSVI